MESSGVFLRWNLKINVKWGWPQNVSKHSLTHGHNKESLCLVTLNLVTQQWFDFITKYRLYWPCLKSKLNVKFNKTRQKISNNYNNIFNIHLSVVKHYISLSSMAITCTYTEITSIGQIIRITVVISI